MNQAYYIIGALVLGYLIYKYKKNSSQPTPRPPTNASIFLLAKDLVVSKGGRLINEADAHQLTGSASYIETGQLGDKASWVFDAPSGTYNLDIIGIMQSNLGIITWSIDGKNIATPQDWFSATRMNNVSKSISLNLGSGRHTLTVELVGKNISSNSHFFFLSEAVLTLL